MDFGKAFTFVFDDESWITKLLIGGVLLFIPIIGWMALLGWMLEIGRRVLRGDAELLPDWNDFGTYLVRGLKGTIINLIYYLPYILLSGCSYGVSFWTANSTLSSGVETIANFISLSASCINFVYSLFVAFLIPAALMRFTMHDDDIAAGLAFGKVIGLVKDNLSTYLIVFLGSIVVSFIIPLGLLAVCVGILITFPYGAAVMGHLYGQSYAEATGTSLATGTPPAAPAASADWEG